MPGRRRSARRRADLSQHFLRSASLARRLVALSSISRDDLVVEAGPGNGVLTRALAERSRRVVAVELDRDLVAGLRRAVWPGGNVEIIGRDFLEFPLPRSPYKFFANIPFARTADIVRKLTLASTKPAAGYLVVQSAAAVRFLGMPFGPESALSLLVKAQFDVTVLDWLNPTDFSPPPSVNSLLLRIARLGVPRVSDAELAQFERFARSVFEGWKHAGRTQLLRHLGARQARGLINELGFPVGSRVSQVSFDHWLTLFRLHVANTSR